MKNLKLFLIAFAAITAANMAVSHYVRPVNAEDDCAFNTYAVYRMPWLYAYGGSILLCIGEPRS